MARKPFNKAGPGRPLGSKSKLANLKHAIYQATTEQDVVNIWRSILLKATLHKDIQGNTIQADVRAAEFVFDRLFGKAPQQVQMDLDVAPEGIGSKDYQDARAIVLRHARRIIAAEQSNGAGKDHQDEDRPPPNKHAN